MTDLDKIIAYCSRCGVRLEAPVKAILADNDGIIQIGVKPGHKCAPYKFRESEVRYGLMDNQSRTRG